MKCPHCTDGCIVIPMTDYDQYLPCETCNGTGEVILIEKVSTETLGDYFIIHSHIQENKCLLIREEASILFAELFKFLFLK